MYILQVAQLTQRQNNAMGFMLYGTSYPASTVCAPLDTLGNFLNKPVNVFTQKKIIADFFRIKIHFSLSNCKFA